MSLTEQWNQRQEVYYKHNTAIVLTTPNNSILYYIPSLGNFGIRKIE